MTKRAAGVSFVSDLVAIDTRLTTYACECGASVALTRLEPLPAGWMTIAGAYGDIVGYACDVCTRWRRRWARSGSRA
ncbi:MAG: hypothetical protein DYG90_03370 [Chloroflexi bacterium CFX6]|nr:hypothetical protein [Chloroflexi bacterium CFX6]